MPDPVMSPEGQVSYDEALKRIEACRSESGTHLTLGGMSLWHLPPEIGQLTALKELHLDNNQLSSLPPQIGQLTALKELYLDNNQLTRLPPEIGQLTALTRLRTYP